MPRYVIVFRLPPAIDAALRQTFEMVLNQKSPIDILHLTLIPPFFLKPEVTEEKLIRIVKTIQSQPITIALTSLGQFQSLGKTIIYVSVAPEAPLQTLSQKLSQTLITTIDYDLSLYDDRHLPPYHPHVSLHYALPTTADLGKLEDNLPHQPFTIKNFTLLKNSTPELWEIINH
ncbi:hypothetical protein A2783_05170 [Microgenomates group bacterium RIFCSPHIGHO2_01_FULL_45_11]|nr:MAG: hypothetical protein A2783_05170 [Microgenomates group bacterium RIFCSPHIGHO2_01_FULL_45_11]